MQRFQCLTLFFTFSRSDRLRIGVTSLVQPWLSSVLEVRHENWREPHASAVLGKRTQFNGCQTLARQILHYYCLSGGRVWRGSTTAKVYRREWRWPRRPVTKAATEKGLVGLVLAREGELRNEANLPTSFCWRPGTDHLIDRINAWDSRIRARNCRCSSMASRVNRSCFSAFLLPRGAPEPSALPCIR